MMFGLSLNLVVCRGLVYVIFVLIACGNVQHILSCVTYVAGFSGLSIFDFGIL